MILPELKIQDIELVKQTVYEAMVTKLSSGQSQQEEQALGGEFLIALAGQAVIPVLVSLSASVLYDILKGKALGALQKNEVREISRELLGKQAKLDNALDSECLKELRSQLAPLGFTDTEINALYESIKRKLTQDNEFSPKDSVVIKILFLAADPTDASRLRLGEEFREVHEKLLLAKLRDRFKLELPQLSVRPADISRALLEVQPQIVHFSGHGTSTGALGFESPAGETHLVKPDALAALFEQFSHQVDCVLLNACYSEIQAKAIADHIKYVIGMNQAIGDKAAIAFAIGFYQALGAGRTIEDSYHLGCVQIRLQGIAEHLTPVLIKEKATQ
jgi:hypothetical protein